MRLGRIPILALAALLLGIGTAGGFASKRSVVLSKPLPSVVRIGQLVIVRGSLRGAPPQTEVDLEGLREGSWSELARARSSTDGRFVVRWRVPKDEQLGPISLRVAALRGRTVLAATPAHESAVGSAPVYCKSVKPPGPLPAGDGLIVGGTYGEGGAYPGIYACYPSSYTLSVTDRNGTAVASEQVPTKTAYAVTVPAGRYTLSGPCEPASASVVAGKRTVANTYCLYP